MGSSDLSTDAHKLRESCNEEYLILEVLESGLLVRVEHGAIDWASGVRDLFNQARTMVRDGADITGLPDEPTGITNVNEARRLVDGIAKWATALAEIQPPPQPASLTDGAENVPVDDPTVYRGAKEFLSEDFPDYKALHRAVDNNPWIRNPFAPR